jgi:hypothetical protein
MRRTISSAHRLSLSQVRAGGGTVILQEFNDLFVDFFDLMA